MSEGKHESMGVTEDFGLDDLVGRINKTLSGNPPIEELVLIDLALHDWSQQMTKNGHAIPDLYKQTENKVGANTAKLDELVNMADEHYTANPRILPTEMKDFITSILRRPKPAVEEDRTARAFDGIPAMTSIKDLDNLVGDYFDDIPPNRLHEFNEAVSARREELIEETRKEGISLVGIKVDTGVEETRRLTARDIKPGGFDPKKFEKVRRREELANLRGNATREIESMTKQVNEAETSLKAKVILLVQKKTELENIGIHLNEQDETIMTKLLSSTKKMYGARVMKDKSEDIRLDENTEALKATLAEARAYVGWRNNFVGTANKLLGELDKEIAQANEQLREITSDDLVGVDMPNGRTSKKWDLADVKKELEEKERKAKIKVEKEKTEERRKKTRMKTPEVSSWLINLFRPAKKELRPIESAATRKINEVKNLDQLVSLLKRNRMREFMLESGMREDSATIDPIDRLVNIVIQYVTKGEDKMHSLQDVPMADGLRKKVLELHRNFVAKEARKNS